jgi:hypothetical protein
VFTFNRFGDVFHSRWLLLLLFCVNVGTHLTDANANALAARGEALRDQMTLKVLEVSGMQSNISAFLTSNVHA